ncbi:aldo/keto reductase [Chromobacterium vaccinii]|uniref:aldo/keto reductase n=1 Tax=Chromobacterium vaccinii TaxID=1108595 RepID=UPI000E148946|nr:aldo/keto reductase [Chromobacterium vaccinii]SUX29961.1 bifunctional regulator KidO [Chromobacterium vaccinii]
MKLALGTVQFGMEYGVANAAGRTTKEEASSILRLARQANMDMLDTAIAYGDSESVLGLLGVQSWKIVTKLSAVPDGCSNVGLWVREQVNASLKRLGTSKLYALLLHRPAQLFEENGRALFAALQLLKAEGLVEKTGVSVYGPTELKLIFNHFPLDLIQAPLSIVDRSLVDSGWGDRLKRAGVEIHTRSAFLQGLLLMPAHSRPVKFNRWENVWSEWERWLTMTGLTPLQACLRYANTLDCVDRVVVGVDSVRHLSQIIEAVTGELPSLPSFKPLQDDRLINPASWNQL